MKNDNRKWISIDVIEDSAGVTDADSIDWTDTNIITSNIDSAHKNNDGTKILISYNGTLPSSINAIASKGEELDNDAMVALLNTDDWSNNIVD